jgi:hypothetical protein
VHSEIRAHLAAMKGNKIGFLEKHATDPRVASAVLGAPPFLSGLSEEEEVSFVQTRVAEYVVPGVSKAKAETLKAREQAEAGWQKAIDKIAERAGLTKAPDTPAKSPLGVYSKSSLPHRR